MKKSNQFERNALLLLAAIVLMFATVGIAGAQTTVVQDTVTKNYYAASTAKAKQADKLTGSHFIDSKGNSYPVYESAKGKLYYKRVSAKTQKTYKVYISTEAK